MSAQKAHYANRGEERHDYKRNDSGSQLSGLERRPSDGVHMEKGSQSPVAEALITVEKDDECISERMFSFVTKLADIFLRAPKQEDQRNAPELIDLLINILLEDNVLIITLSTLRVANISSQKRTVRS